MLLLGSFASTHGRVQSVAQRILQTRLSMPAGLSLEPRSHYLFLLSSLVEGETEATTN
jgi:hypothetical protein